MGQTMAKTYGGGRKGTFSPEVFFTGYNTETTYTEIIGKRK